MSKQFDPLKVVPDDSDLVDVNPASLQPSRPQAGKVPDDFDLVDADPKVTTYLKGTGNIVEMPQSMLERIGKIASGAYDKGNAATEINSIYFKKWMGDNQPYFDKRIEELQQTTGSKIMTQGLIEEAVRATAEQTPQLIEMAKKALVRGTQVGVAGAGVGAAVGSVVPGVGTAAGATTGGVRGFQIGAQIGIIENSFIQNTGSSYEEYSNYKGKDGKPIGDTDAVRLAALVSGASQAGLDVLPMKAFSKIIPFRSELMQKLEKTGAKSLVLPKGKDNIVGFIRDLVAAQAIEVGTEGAQEGIQAWVGEGLKKYLSDQDIAPAASGEILKRVGDVMKESALSIVPIATTGAVVGKGVETGVNLARERKAQTVQPLEQKISDIAKQADQTQEAAVVPASSFSKEEQTVLKDAGVVDENNNVNVPTGEQNLAGVLSKIQESRRSGALDEATQGTQNNIDNTVLEGRLKKLDDNISVIDKQIDAVTQLIETKQKNNQATARDEQKLNTLVNRRDLFDEERANILTTQSPRTTETLTLGDKTANIQVKSPALVLSEGKNLTINESKLQNIGQTAIRDINKSFREGRSLAKKDVTEAQNFITTVIDQSALAPADKAKFIRTIKNIKDAEGLTKKLPEIQSRISNLVEAASRRQLKADIKSALSKTKPKKQSGKPVGKFDASTQSTLDRLRNASKLSVEDAKTLLKTRNEISANDAKSGKLPSYEDALESAILSSIADSDNTKVSDLQNLKNDIEQLIAEGKTSRQNALIAKKAKADELRSGIDELITQGRNLQLIDKSFSKLTGEKLFSFHSSLMNYDWNDILDIILPPSKQDPNLKTSIIESLKITKLVQKEKGIVRERRDAFIDAAKDAFGFKKEGDLNEKFYQDSQKKVIGNFYDANGKEVRLRFSKAEARKLWMELQDESIREAIESPEGNAYTQEMINAVMNTLDSKDINFAKSQLKLYQEFLPQIDKVYSRINGTSLISIDNYSPIAREVDKNLDVGTNEFLQEIFVRQTVSSKSFISRVDSLGALRHRSDVEVYQKHITEMAHFIAMAEKIQQIQQIFGEKNLRKNIDLAYGDGMLELIDETIDGMAKNGAIKSNAFDRVVNGLNRTFALSKLGGKIALAPKQLTSTIAYWEDMSAKDFIGGIIDFTKNPKKAIETLNKSELVRARGIPEVDLARLGKTTKVQEKYGQLFRKTRKLQDLLLLPTKFGDKGAILVGGWAYYRSQIKKGKTHEQAIDAFEEITARTQQSTDIDRLGRLQRGNALTRGLTMFITSPNAFLKQEVKAVRQFKRGEISGKDFGKKIFLYHFALPALFQFVANGFTFDEEDQLVAVATGSLNGYLIIGDVISNTIRSLTTGDKFKPADSIKFLKSIQDIFYGIADAAENFGDTEEMLDAASDIASGAGSLTGLPVDQAKNMAEGIDDFDSGRPVRGTLRFLGYPKKSVEEIDN